MHRVGVIGQNIDAGVVAGLLVHLFGALVAAEDVGVHHHRACGGIGKPAHIEVGVGLASPEEPPFAIHPNFHPCVVVVTVRPTRGVTLTGGDAHGAESGHREGALLAATTVRGLQCGQRCRSPHISRLIVNIFVTPVVHLQSRIVHAHILDTVFQLVEDIRPRGVQILVVHAIDHHKMAENVVWNRLSPREGLPCFQRHLHLILIEIKIIIDEIAHRHIGVEESKIFSQIAFDFLLIQRPRPGIIHPLTHISWDVGTVLIIMPHRTPVVGLRESCRSQQKVYQEVENQQR